MDWLVAVLGILDGPPPNEAPTVLAVERLRGGGGERFRFRGHGGAGRTGRRGYRRARSVDGAGARIAGARGGPGARRRGCVALAPVVGHETAEPAKFIILPVGRHGRQMRNLSQ